MAPLKHSRNVKRLTINTGREQEICSSQDSAIAMMTPPTTPDDDVAKAAPTTSQFGDTLLPPDFFMRFNPADIKRMAEELAFARANGEFPTTTTPGYDVRAIANDHTALTRLRQLRGDAPRGEWNAGLAGHFLVNITNRIRERDALQSDTAALNNVRTRVEAMAHGVNAEAAMYQLIQHAVNSVLPNHKMDVNAPENMTPETTALLRGIQDRISVLTQSQHEMYSTVGGLMNQIRTSMEARPPHEQDSQLIEHMFTFVEALEDPTCPLRVDVNRMAELRDSLAEQNTRHAAQIRNLNAHDANLNAHDANLNAHDANLNAHDANLNAHDANLNAHDANLNAHDANLNGQVTAISQHVNAIGSHVGSLGHHLNAMDNNLSCVTGSVNAMSTQVNVLQTVTNMLPEMVARAVREVVPQVVHGAVESAINGDVVTQFDTLIRAVLTVGATSGGLTKGEKESAKTSDKKVEGHQKKPSFFRKLFGRGRKN